MNYKLLNNNNNKLYNVNNQYYYAIDNIPKQKKNIIEQQDNLVLERAKCIEHYTFNDTNYNISFDTNTIINFSNNVTCDVLLVGGGGGGGCGSGGGGGAGSGISHIKNYTFNNGTYSLIIGQGGIGGMVAPLTETKTTIEKKVETITDNKTITIYNNSTAKFTYNNDDNKINLPAGTYNISFNNGIINVGSYTNNMYPTLVEKNNNIIPILPFIWYKFDDALSFLNDNYNTVNKLINNNINYDTTSFVKGIGSIHFDGANKYAIIPNNINLNLINTKKGISFSLWFKISSLSDNWARIFDFGTQFNNEGKDYIAFGRQNTSNNLFVEICTSTLITTTTYNWKFTGKGIFFGLEYIGTTTTTINTRNKNTSVLSDINYIDNIWRHFVFTISPSGYWNIYINNVNKHSSQQTIIPYFYTTNTFHYLGKSLYTNDGAFNGNIDDFRIYDFVLTVEQIKELYQGRVQIEIETTITTTITKDNENNALNIYNSKNGSRGGDTIIYNYDNINKVNTNLALLAFGGTGGYRSKIYENDLGETTKLNASVDSISVVANSKYKPGKGGITYLFNNQDIANLTETDPSKIFTYLNNNDKIKYKAGYEYYYSSLFNVYYGGRGGSTYENELLTIDYNKQNQNLNGYFNNDHNDENDYNFISTYGETEIQTEIKGLTSYGFNHGYKGNVIDITSIQTPYGGGGGGGVTRTSDGVINATINNGEGTIGQGGKGGDGINNNPSDDNYKGTDFTNYNGMNGQNGIIIIKFNNSTDYMEFIEQNLNVVVK